jgi:predicted transcriptional regulator/transcriptional regulator with XRE-family HTH domain
MRAPIGIRISSRRKALGLRQADLARRAGISASYLNLIEANKRQVAGALLKRIASGLDIDIEQLTGESEHRLIQELEEALADPALASSNAIPVDARELVASRPEIAAIIVRLHRAYEDATTSAEAYASRLRADPLLAELLHQILSGITAVRSSAEILTDVADLEAPARERFAQAISREAQGLTSVAQTLLGQFDVASQAARGASPRRELDDLLFGSDNYFPTLEQAAQDIRTDLGETAPSEAGLANALSVRFGIAVVRTAEDRRDGNGFPAQYGFDRATRELWFKNGATLATRRFQMARMLSELSQMPVIEALLASPLLTTDAARSLARSALSSYLAGAVLLPYDAFLDDAERVRYDIEALRERYSASFEQVAHRLVTLRRPGATGVPFGFLRSDPAGRLTKQFPLPGLLLPGSGHACPLWAIYGAFRTPGSLVRQIVRFPDGSRYLFIAQTVSRRPVAHSDAVLSTSIMLACAVLDADRTIYADGLDLLDQRADTPVGPACRLCTRADCASRQERAMTPGEQDAPVRAPLVGQN